MSQFPNTKGQKTMAESDPVVLPSDQIISVDSNGEYLATELTVSSILSAVQQQSDYETKLVVDSLDVTYLEVRTWNSSTGTFNPPTYYLPNSNTPATPTPPLAYINPNTYLSLIVSNTTDINLEDTQQLVLTAVTNSELLLNDINNKLVNGTDIGDVTINNGAGVSAVNIQDGGNSITVDATALPLPTGAATEATLLDVKTSVQLLDDCVGTDNTAAPTKSLVVAGVTAGGTQQTIEVNASGHVNISDGGGSITVDGSVSITGEVEIINAVGSPIPVTVVAPVPVINVNLDAADDQVGVYGYINGVSSTPTPLNVNATGHVAIQDGGNSITVDAIDLDIRNLTFATDKVDIGGSVVGLDATTLSALENITIQNGGGVSAVNIQDGGNVISIDDAGGSITVDGTVALDSATLSALENITVQNGSGASAVNIQDGGNSITVDAIDLDIRDLVFATDKVDVGGSVVGLDATTLSALESITVQNGSGAAAVNIQDGGNSITVDGGTGFQRTPNISRPSGVTGSTPSGSYSVSISSVGTANATVGGITLKPGETLSFDGGGINNTISPITYSTLTAGAELIIITLT